MSHELSVRENGFAEMAYVGETPWHSLGNELKAGASVNEWISAAGMDWKILRSKIRYQVSRDDGPDTLMVMDDRQVLFRSDNKKALSTVSDQFKIVQPREVLEFFRGLTETAGFQLETAGCLFDGRRFWALASTGQNDYIADKRDQLRRYLLLSTSCDGSMATEGRYTNIRVVCHNTLSAAQGDASRFRLTHRSVFKAAECQKELGIESAEAKFKATIDSLRRLADTKVGDHDAMLQTVELFRPGAAQLAKEDLVKALELKPVARINSLTIDGGAIGSAFEGTTGTQWGWLNAVTQYVDHEAKARTQDNRLAAAWFGKGDELKERALELATSAANGTPEVSYLKFQAARGLI